MIGLKGFEGFESGLNGLGSPVDNRILEYYGRTITVETVVPLLWNTRVQRVWNDRDTRRSCASQNIDKSIMQNRQVDNTESRSRYCQIHLSI